MVRRGDGIKLEEGVILASWEKHFIRVCKNLSQYPPILYPFFGTIQKLFKYFQNSHNAKDRVIQKFKLN